MAEEFAARHEMARALKRPRAPPSPTAATPGELKSFEWARAQLEQPYDIVVKMDADLELMPSHIETVEAAFGAESKLGIAAAT